MKLFLPLGLALALATAQPLAAQKPKVLFDASHAQMAGNADWVIDADKFDLGPGNDGRMTPGRRNEANPQRVPTPAAAGITANTPETYWQGGLSAWAVELVKRGFEVETLPNNGQFTYGNRRNAQDLTNYKVLIICEPNIAFTDEERRAIIAFVDAGGGLFLIGDHDKSDRNNDGCDSPCVFNALLAANPFGIKFNLDNIKETSSAFAQAPFSNGPYGRADRLKFSNGATMSLSGAAKAVVTRQDNPGQAMCAYSTYGKGRVVALGDSSPADDGTGDPNDRLYPGWTEVRSHAILIMNATLWLAGQ
ncbi:MAG: GldG family protein [Bernardetiaceae bacterium]|jgi:hypothetical protein|nr:GldG family protein [Bernardetiaceae bacterium]